MAYSVGGGGFGFGNDANRDVLSELVGAGIRAYLIKQGEPLAVSLTEPIRESEITTPDVDHNEEEDPVEVTTGGGE